MRILKMMGVALALTGFWACAASHRPQTAAEATSPGDRELRRGIYWYHKGCMQKAMDHLKAAHEHYCLTDQRSGTARSLNSLANVYRQSGNLADALLFYDAAIDAARRSGDRTLVAQALSNKAAALLDRADTADHGDVKALLDEAQRLVRKGPVYAMVLTHRAVLAMETRHFDEAGALLDRADDAAGRQADRTAAAIRFTRGRLMMKAGNTPQAQDQFEQALALDRQTDFAKGMAADLDALAEIHEQGEAYGSALDCLERSIKIYALLEDRRRVLKQLDHLQQLAAKSGGDIRVTLYFVNQWLAGEAMDAVCR